MRNNNRITAVSASISALLALLPIAALAEQTQAIQNNLESSPLIVTATRTASNVDQVLATSIVIDTKGNIGVTGTYDR